MQFPISSTGGAIVSSNGAKAFYESLGGKCKFIRSPEMDLPNKNNVEKETKAVRKGLTTKYMN